MRLITNIVGCEPDAVRRGMAVEVRIERQFGSAETTYFRVFAPRSSP